MVIPCLEESANYGRCSVWFLSRWFLSPVLYGSFSPISDEQAQQTNTLPFMYYIYAKTQKCSSIATRRNNWRMLKMAQISLSTYKATLANNWSVLQNCSRAAHRTMAAADYLSGTPLLPNTPSPGGHDHPMVLADCCMPWCWVGGTTAATMVEKCVWRSFC